MKKFMEKVSILSLSMILTTAFSISSAQSAMFAFYRDLPESQVELLISLPSAGIMVMLLLNSLIERYLTERQMMVTGLLIFSLCGCLPLVNQDYWLVFASRLGFGMGVGLLNAKAISIISERYQGRERVEVLGLRGSAEVVGTALLTFGVSRLLPWGWQVSFLVYAVGLVVLYLYLLFVPYDKESPQAHREEAQAQQHLSREDWRLTLGLALVAAVIVLTNVAINVRVPALVEKSGLGTAQTAGVLLALMQLTGIAAGLSFARLTSFFRERLLTYAGLTFGLAQICIGWAPNIWLLSLATVFAGFAYSVSLTTIFYRLSERLPVSLLNTATSWVIVGCSGGATATPLVLSLLSGLSLPPSQVFTALGGAMMLASLLALLLSPAKAQPSIK